MSQICRFSGSPDVSNMFWGEGMTGARTPLKIATINKTILPHGKAAGALVTGADTLARPKPKLFDQLREALRSRHYSRRTEQTYCYWVKRFIFFHHVRHPAEMAEPEMNQFLTHLAVKEHVSASTLIYTHVLNRGPTGVRSPIDGL